MRTEISSIGKEEAIKRLFTGSGFINAAVITADVAEPWCSAHKIMLEGVDFDLVYNPLKHLGYKAVLNVLGDIYAAFYDPLSVSVDLGISSRFSYEDVQQLWTGILAAAKEHGVKHLSLDLNPSLNGLCISLSATGTQKKAVLEQRPAVKNMDLICLSGRVGAAYMGMQVLEREKKNFESSSCQPNMEKYKHILASYLSPEVKPNTVSRFVEEKVFPSKGMFLTKGLGDAIIRLTRDTGFGAKIYLERIPLSNETFAMAEDIDMDPVTAAMNGGDDYQFIFTVPIEKNDTLRRDWQDYDIIGHLARPEAGAVLVTPEGAEIPLKAQAYTAAE